MARTNPNGKAVLRASFALFRQDRQIVWLPVLGAIAWLAAFGAIEVGGLVAFGIHRWTTTVISVVGAAAGMAACQLFLVATCVAAAERIEGRTPSVRGALSGAWRHRWRIAQWSVFASVVGGLLRALERRFGALGAIVGFAGTLAWAVATFLVVPVLAFEDIGPIDAVRRASSLLKGRFGTVGRSALRFGLLFAPWYLGSIALLVGGSLIVRANAVGGVIVIGVAVTSLIVVGMFATTAGLYMRTVLYRFAVGLPVPDLGVDRSRTFDRDGSPNWPLPPQLSQR